MKKDLSKLLLDWYKINGRNLPWRHKGGAHPNPYVVLVSEFMLQQTTVKTVIPYFEKFMKRFPTIYELAKASQEEVFNYWQGLGYYTRARSLLKTAQSIVYKKNGVFPKTKEEVLKLKGVGPYTASSFLALAFNKPESVVDGNVVRVISRLFYLTKPLDLIKEDIKKKAEIISSKTEAADYASAIMDLGAMICTPKKPQCFRCPWQGVCRSKNKEDVEYIPFLKKQEKPVKTGFAYLVKNNEGQILIRKRTEKGLLNGLYEVPWNESDFIKSAKKTKFEVIHVFTHFKLVLRICMAEETSFLEKGIFVKYEDISSFPISTLMKKILTKAKQENLI